MHSLHVDLLDAGWQGRLLDQHRWRRGADRPPPAAKILVTVQHYRSAGGSGA